MGKALDSADPVEGKAVHRTALAVLREMQWPVEMLRELKGSPE